MLLATPKKPVCVSICRRSHAGLPPSLVARVPQVALLRSAVKLEQEQQFLIAKKLQELSGSKNIKLKPTIDESVIAGFIVEYGSSQIDMSVRGQVENVTEVSAVWVCARVGEGVGGVAQRG